KKKSGTEVIVNDGNLSIIKNKTAKSTILTFKGFEDASIDLIIKDLLANYHRTYKGCNEAKY
ncbi:hypothetical protein, partial [Vibrio rarus]